MPLLRNVFVALALLAALVAEPAVADADDSQPAEAEHLRVAAQAVAEFQAGRLQEAVISGKRALALAERATGKSSQDTADQVWNVGRFQETVGKFAEAERAYARALPIYEKLVGANHPYVAEVLMATARVRAAQSNHKGALSAFLRMVAILEPLSKTDPALELQLAGYLAAGASIYELLNQRDEAERLLLRAMATFEARFGKDDVRITQVLALLGKLYYQRGKYAEALEAHQRHLTLYENQFGTDSPNLMTPVANVAADLHALGRMAEAQRHFHRALELHKAFKTDHNERGAALLANYCAFLRERGDLGSAVVYCKRAVTAFDSLHAEGYGLGMALGHLGAAYVDMNNLADGLPYLQRSLKLRRKFWGEHHPMVGYALITLASVYNRAGQHAEAQAHAQQALDLMIAAYGPDHTATADAIDIQALLREPKDRLELLQRVLEIRRRGLGSEHPHVARSWFEIAKSHLARGEPNKSREAMARCNAIREKHLSLVLGVGSEIQKSQAVDMLSDEMGATITLHLRHLADDAAAARLAFDTILQRKGRAVDALVSDLGVLRAGAKPEDRQLLDELAAERASLAGLLLHEAGAEAGPPSQGQVVKHDPAAEAKQRLARVAALRTSVLVLEQRVAERSATFRRASQRATFEQLRAVIPSDAALVELVAYWPQGWDPTAKRQHEHYRYAAYVLRSDGKIVGVDLGPVPTVNEAVASLRQALANRETNPDAAAHKLEALVMAPLEAALGDTERIFLSADGMLSMVPFAALVDGRGRPLVERYLFTYLAGARELLRDAVAAPRERGPEDVVLVGAPAFGSMAKGNESRAGHPLGLGFPPLPGARTEVTELAANLEGATALIGEAATEGAMKALRGPRIVHIATHGFFVGEGAMQAGGARGVETVVLADRDDQLGPLLRSGLAFAGANDGGTGDDDGVLTAMEAASLDLSGTELVVLSACETGVGATSQGDGVRGLRRSLSIAGARTQVMSLWKVDDEATRKLMVGYYEQLAAGVGRSAALRNVQLTMMRDEQTAHPYYWAGFIVSGSDAPLELSKRAEPQPATTTPGQRGCACEIGGEVAPVERGGVLLGLLLAVLVRRRRSPRTRRSLRTPSRRGVSRFAPSTMGRCDGQGHCLQSGN